VSVKKRDWGLGIGDWRRKKSSRRGAEDAELLFVSIAEGFRTRDGDGGNILLGIIFSIEWGKVAKAGSKGIA